MCSLNTIHEQVGLFGMCDANDSVHVKLEDLGQRRGPHLDELVRLARVLRRHEIGRPKKVNAFVCETGSRPYSRETLEPTRFHTDFFQHLPLSTYPPIRARAQPAGRHLDCPPL